MQAIHKNVIVIGGAFLLLISFIAAFTAQPLLLLLPLIVILGFYFLQFPRSLFLLLVFTVPWSFEYHFSNGLGIDIPDEPLMLIAAFTGVALWLARLSKRRQSKKWRPLVFVLAIEMAWLAITVALSSHPLLSLKYFAAKSWYLLAFVMLPIVLHNDERLIKQGAISLFISMLMVTIIGLFRHAQGGFTFSSVNYSLYPFFRNHVNYSALLVCLVPIAIAFLQYTNRRWLRLLLFITILLLCFALYVSYSRGAWLALIVGLTAYWLLKKRWLLKSFFIAMVMILAGVCWLTASDRYLQFAPDHNSTIFHTDFKEHLIATYEGKDVSTAERFYRWVAGVRMLKDGWGTGFGPATFYQHYKSYTVPLYKTWVSDNKEHSTVHNYFLLLLIEQGVIGLLLFLLLLAAMFWYAEHIYHSTQSRFWKIMVTAIASILLMQGTLNFLSDLVETDKAGSIFYLCVAVLIMADRNIEHKTRNLNKSNRNLT